MRKRVLTAMCCTAALLSLISCKTNQTQESQTQTEDNLSVSQITVGSSIFAPYFYVGQDGNFTGADEEIAKEAFNRMGVEVTFEDMIWGERERLLEKGEIDCIWGCFVMDGRESQYQWAGPYLTSELSAVVSADSDIQSVDDLNGKTVAVRIDSKAEEYFLGKIIDDYPIPEMLTTFNSMHEAFVWFGKGYADAIVEHRAALIEQTKEKKELYRFLDGTLFTANLGVAFRKDYDSTIVDKLTEVLNEMKADGTIAQIAERFHVRGYEDQGETADGT